MQVKTIKDAFDILQEKVALQSPPSQGKRILNELSSVYYRQVLPGMGWHRADYTAKLTAAEKRAADEFAATQGIRLLPTLLACMERGFELTKASSASRATYGARLKSALALLESEPWYPGNTGSNRLNPDECRPPMRHGRGDVHDFSLMPNKGKPKKYTLEPHEISPKLQAQLDDFFLFMTDLHRCDRQFSAIEQSTAKGYDKDAKLLLGFLLHVQNPNLSPEDLSLELLIPLVSEEELQSLNQTQQKRLWQSKQAALNSFIQSYFDFLAETLNAESPRTQVRKLAGLLMIAKYVYAMEVETATQYAQIPLIQTLDKRMKSSHEAVKEWQKNRRYVADQSRKWLTSRVSGRTCRRAGPFWNTSRRC